VSDPVGVTCGPLTIIEERDEDRLVQRIVTVAQEQGVSEIVVGLPRPLAGGTNPQSDASVSFAARVQRATSIPVHMWDERFTSKLAGKEGTRRGPRDAVAACYMLQSYLDSRADHREDS
jgi:putative Holliday junction resolvase